ncbi:pyruvate dehydrogenase phosphatase regulatory subunit, mitochondrial [Tribolium castaneum]|uniref:Pyruvate dehydrogenase phosphatase regulatory subunit, mitochondrial-like Protein n=1 Tax=Tribolium castaneum TaxID=7070 RepID=D6W886_TRICA|nr:PREDICTED: pyruvate dehydrogenase phosphatase regulatory subunit, mitochondrial [Tribolium castaneum]EFA10911.2 Pyruvate dehydrogenase phosphatase regulatory subunit, mitochondrial-like Protein [Tribolium castaneum]|eukprot:XP_008199020.1 PREDICTED: pyruvate dehydrogenase phosphatase regulatory subunit, mitochondrial [Tribolium castaneum]
MSLLYRAKFGTDILSVTNPWKCIRNNSNAPPTQARIVIAGAGVVANSVAYHLVQNGWSDIIVLEQGKIGSGTSHFGSGTLGLFKPIAHRNLIWYSIKLYQQLQDMGYDIQMRQCGSINLAQTNDRLIALKRRLAYNIPTGLYCELLSPNELKDLHPYLRVDDLKGAVWVPEDAVANPRAICDVLAILAQQGGAQYFEHTPVDKVLTQNSTVYGVETPKGVIKCEYFVNCAGMWARELGLQCSPQVRIPAYPAQHFYATTGRLTKIIDESTPIIRDYDAFTYAREHEGGFMIGWFEEEAKPAFEDSQVPRDWLRHVKKDFNHFFPLWEQAIRRIPELSNCKKPEIVNSPDNFTPDGRWILGETAEVTNYFVACGMNGNSLQGAGGIGKAVAEWIIEGEPTQDLLPFNVQRFLDVHNSRQYLQQRIKEIVGRHYSILYPFQCEYKYARKLRCSPLYSVLETKGAVFGIKMAYERALYFDSRYMNGDSKPIMPPGSFFKPKFFDYMKEEYLACREGVGIIDMSSFSKIEIKSDHLEVVNYLQRLCSNDIDIAVGGIVHTGMQNERGGYENDCMLVRQADNKYFMVSPTSQQTRIYEWISRNLPKKSSIDLNDVTSMYTVINVVGPKAHELLNELSNSDMRLTPFSYKKVNMGYASDVMVMSFTHTGEPGYCLYVPSEYALHIYYKLMTVGRDYGVRDVGTLTQRFMRIERFIPFWAEELSSFTTPFEAGNGYSVRLDKRENFIGKPALQQQKENGVTKQLVFFHLNDIDPDKDIWPWGGEPLYRNNEFVGTVTSAGYGFSADKLICLGFIRRPKSSSVKTITSEYILSKEAKYEIDIAGTRFSIMPYLHAPPVTNTVNLGQKYRPTVIRYKSDVTS